MAATLQLLERYKNFHEITSDYAAAKKLGVTRATVSKWRNGGTMDAATVAQIAQELGIDFDAALSEVQLERPISARDRAIWERFRARVPVALLAALAIGWGSGQSGEALASPEASPMRQLIHYAPLVARAFIAAIKTALRRRRLQWLRPLAIETA